ncbi:hypothetical protein [Chryseobacterium binzhouense]|uniref:hypothetical protein n=1 Tax=Chryseobacterium binzhouense TaxID=2593646 RepID=UPI00117CD8A2|nr:hypothetical protein [Chryseobacterium binzhouense]
MSKKKLLIKEMFNKAKEETGKKTKNALASYLWSYFDERFPKCISDRTLSRYYDAFIDETRDEIEVEDFMLDRFSEYVGFKNFTDFSRTFIKKDEAANKTMVKISVGEDEESLTEKLSNIIINITNEQNFKIPDFIKKNGLGILEMTFVLLLVTGGVMFSNKKTPEPFNWMSGWGSPAIDKPYMYWENDRYMATDSSYLGPQINVVPMNPSTFTYLKKITRPDTLNINNFRGKVWYDKSNNRVDFFTSFGRHPENGKTLKEATDRIIENYAGSDNENQD